MFIYIVIGAFVLCQRKNDKQYQVQHVDDGKDTDQRVKLRKTVIIKEERKEIEKERKQSKE